MNKNVYKEAVDDIKVSEELVKEVSIKMNEKPRRMRRAGSYSIMAASIAVIIMAVVFIQSKIGLTIEPEKKISQLTAGDTISLSKGKGNIYINKIEGIKSAKLFIPEGAYSKDFTMQQLTEFFGRNPVPVIPEGFKQEADNTNITFDPQGKILFMNTMIYRKDIDNPDSPSINIKLNKNALPVKDCLYNSDELKESFIGTTSIVIGAMSMEDKFNDEGKATSHYDLYSAEFIYNGIGYNITAERVDGETFLNFLKSIINSKPGN